MINLERKVFGKITAKEIIGSFPSESYTEDILKLEFNRLLKLFKSYSSIELKEILVNQQNSEKEVNSKPGSMVLDQSKIRLFTKYSQKYIQAINDKIDNH